MKKWNLYQTAKFNSNFKSSQKKNEKLLTLFCKLWLCHRLYLFVIARVCYIKAECFFSFEIFIPPKNLSVITECSLNARYVGYYRYCNILFVNVTLLDREKQIIINILFYFSNNLDYFWRGKYLQ